VLLAVLLLATAGLTGKAAGSGADPAAVEPVRMLVRFAPALDAGERMDVARRFDGRVRRALAGGSIAAIELPAGEVGALRRDPRVVEVEPDPVHHAAALARTELTPALDNGLYGLVLTHAVDAQARGVAGAGVRVCVADTGIDARHPDIAPAYRGGFDLVDDDESPDVGTDAGLGGHGTMVAGVIAAALNRKGVRGVAYRAELVHARVLGADGTGRGSDIMAAVQRLVEREGCRVVNLSLGSTQPSDIEESFYRDLLARNDALVVAASGNDGAGVGYPAGYPGVLAVGAVDPEAHLASFSNRGNELDLVAPGVAVLSAVPRGSGTEAYVVAGRTWNAVPFVYASLTKGLRGRLVDCGTGNTPEEFPSAVRGAIALMRRGDAYFSVKVENAMNAGARGALITNNVSEPVHGTLQTPAASGGRPWIPAVLVSLADGDAIRQRGKPVTLFNVPTDWDVASGTSFAAPHVTGAAALVLSVDPSLGREGVVELLESTAKDLGEPGLDPGFGWGLVDAEAATQAAAH
jgi:subtilisin family serine protease